MLAMLENSRNLWRLSPTERFAMRQVNRDEPAHILQAGMQDWAMTLLKDLQDHDPERRLLARLIAAGLLANKLKRLEILTNAPGASGFGRVRPWPAGRP